MTAWYRAGTVTATNGSATVTGALTAWLANVKVGDAWCPDADGRGYEVTAVNSNTSITIFPVYAGTTGSGKAYGIARFSPNWNSVSEISVSLAEILSASSSILAGNGVPSDSLGTDGDVYFRQDVAEYYTKGSGTWTLVTSLIGPQGPAGPSYQATSTSSNTISNGAKTFTVEADRGYTENQYLRATYDNSNYVEGWVSSYSGTTLVLNVSRAIGTGTYADWDINICGDPGSVNSLAIGSVTASAPGSSASANITGVAPSQTLNLTLPRGEPGPANSLSIGTVTEGSAAASITGTAPTQVLNLVVPKGNAATIAIGTVGTVDPGYPATVTNSGTSGAAVLDFEIPRGEQGIAGATGPNTGLDYQWDSGTADSDPGDGDVRVNSADWGLASSIFISKTGRNGEALGSVIAALCGANNSHRAHIRIFTLADRAVCLEADVNDVIVDGGNYWKIPISNVVVSLVQPTAGNVLSINISRSGDGVSADVQSITHAFFGGI